MTMPLVFVDTETTGLHTDKQLWEVALIRRDFDNELVGKHRETRYEAFVPVDLSNADLFGLNVGRFYERHPLGRRLSQRALSSDKTLWSDWDEHASMYIAHDIARFTHGARFIGAAPSFDAEVLGDFLRKNGLLPTWHHRLVDTHDILTGYLIGAQKIQAHQMYLLSKDAKTEMVGVPPHTDVHTAMGDAQHEADIWDAVMG